jgi:AraC-like DNA-binding protein
MIDHAAQQMQAGRCIAAERCSGVNDDMAAAHCHPYFELYYLESGRRDHFVNGQVCTLDPGQFVLFAPMSLHGSFGAKDSPFCRIIVYFTSSCVHSARLAAALNQAGGIYRLPVRQDALFHSVLDALLAAQDAGQPFAEELCCALLGQLLVAMLRNTPMRRQQIRQGVMGNVLAYLNQNYAQELTIQVLADQFYLSPYYLCHEFKRYTGTSVVAYLNAVRLIKAQQMLGATGKSITEISGEVGFSSLTHFGRIFRQSTGMTPSAFRRAAQGTFCQHHSQNYADPIETG